jgi:hypothetical protein
MANQAESTEGCIVVQDLCHFEISRISLYGPSAGFREGSQRRYVL